MCCGFHASAIFGVQSIVGLAKQEEEELRAAQQKNSTRTAA